MPWQLREPYFFLFNAPRLSAATRLTFFVYILSHRLVSFEHSPLENVVMPSKSYSFLVTLYLSLALLFTLFQSGFQTIFNLKIIILNITGKSLSEALIFSSTNPQYDDRLLIELQVQCMKIPSSNPGRTCCVQKLFLTFRTIFVHNMLSPCSAKR